MNMRKMLKAALAFEKKSCRNGWKCLFAVLVSGVLVGPMAQPGFAAMEDSSGMDQDWRSGVFRINDETEDGGASAPEEGTGADLNSVQSGGDLDQQGSSAEVDAPVRELPEPVMKTRKKAVDSAKALPPRKSPAVDEVSVSPADEPDQADPEAEISAAPVEQPIQPVSEEVEVSIAREVPPAKQPSAQSLPLQPVRSKKAAVREAVQPEESSDASVSPSPAEEVVVLSKGQASLPARRQKTKPMKDNPPPVEKKARSLKPKTKPYHFEENLIDAQAMILEKGGVESEGVWKEGRFSFAAQSEKMDIKVVSYPQEKGDASFILFSSMPGATRILRFSNVPPGKRLKILYGFDPSLEKRKEKSFFYFRVLAGRKELKRYRFAVDPGWRSEKINLGILDFLKRDVAVTFEISSDYPQEAPFVFQAVIT